MTYDRFGFHHCAMGRSTEWCLPEEPTSDNLASALQLERPSFYISSSLSSEYVYKVETEVSLEFCIFESVVLTFLRSAVLLSRVLTSETYEERCQATIYTIH
jgi:hypothetical protein